MKSFRNIKALWILAALFAGCTGAPPAKSRPPEDAATLKADIRTMWKTVPLPGDHGERASSHEAQEAAARVFTNEHLRGLTRAELIALVGDPVRSSESRYNFPFYPVRPGNVVVYRFDTGSYGWQFNVTLNRHGRVARVDRQGIE